MIDLDLGKFNFNIKMLDLAKDKYKNYIFYRFWTNYTGKLGFIIALLGSCVF